MDGYGCDGAVFMTNEEASSGGFLRNDKGDWIAGFFHRKMQCLCSRRMAGL